MITGSKKLPTFQRTLPFNLVQPTWLAVKTILESKMLLFKRASSSNHSYISPVASKGLTINNKDCLLINSGEQKKTASRQVLLPHLRAEGGKGVAKSVLRTPI